MATALDFHFKFRAIVTNKRPLNSHFKFRSIVTNKRPYNDSVKGLFKIAFTRFYQLKKTTGKFKIRENGFFDTMFTVPEKYDPPVIPSRSEIDSVSAVRVYLQLPDYYSGDILIPKERIKEVFFDWRMNQEILFNIKLINLDRVLLDPNENYYRFLRNDGFYEEYNSTRKFFKIGVRTWVGNKAVNFWLPRLVVKDCPPGDYVLNFSGWDYITEVLSQEINLPSFCAMEALERVTNKIFKVNNLTNKGYINELYVNYELFPAGDGPFPEWTYDPDTQIVTFSSDVNPNFVVMAKNPVSKFEAIKSVCRQSVNKLPNVITKEHITIKFTGLEDQYFTNELATFNTLPKETFKKLVNSFPADYLIMPSENTLSLNIMPKVLGDEYPPKANFYLPETLFKGKPNISKNSLKSYNFGNLKRPSRVYETNKPAVMVGNYRLSQVF